MPNDILDRLEKREGGLSNDPADTGGRTYKGVSERWNADLWKDGPPTDAQVRERYEQRYVKGPGFDRIVDAHLREQLIDIAVHSGPGIAIQKLQAILAVTADGALGPKTLAALAQSDSHKINNLLVAARILMLCRIVQKNPTQVKFVVGWCDRALQFLV